MSSSPTSPSSAGRWPRRITHRLLLVSADGDLELLLRPILEAEQFIITTSRSGEAGLRSVMEMTFDIILIDRLLPDGDGSELCSMIRGSDRAAGLPIVLVSTMDEEDDVVSGLRSGADDYVRKPIRTRELIERLRVRILRPPARFSGEMDSPIRIGDMVIDPSRLEVFIDGRSRDVSPTEFKILHYLVRHPGIVYTWQHLVDVVKQRPNTINNRTIAAHIQHLRSKIDPYHDLIKTIHSVGYMFDYQDPESA